MNEFILPEDIVNRILLFLNPHDLLSMAITAKFLSALVNNTPFWKDSLKLNHTKFFNLSYKLTFLKQPEFRTEHHIDCDTKGKNYLLHRNKLSELTKNINLNLIFSKVKIKDIVLGYISSLKNQKDKLECMIAVLFHDDEKFKKIIDKDLLLKFAEIHPSIISLTKNYFTQNSLENTNISKTLSH